MDQFDLLEYVVRVLNDMKIPYFVTGGVASIFYGEPRFTNDIDLVCEIRENHIDRLCQSFPPEDFHISREAIIGALKHKTQFNIIHPGSGLKVDVMISRDDEFDLNRFHRAGKLHKIRDTGIFFASPEDVIIKKMEYYREGASEKHIRDILSMLKISGEVIDRKYIEQWAEKKNLTEIWSAVIARIG
jgi:hypothetical protein